LKLANYRWSLIQPRREQFNVTGAEFGQFIEAFADMLTAAGAIGQASTWRALAPVFRIKPSASVKELCKVMSGASASAGTDDTCIKNVVTSIDLLKRCIGENAKKALLNDLTTLAGALSPFEGVTVADFVDATTAKIEAALSPQVPAPSGDLINSYLLALEAALGDDAKFREVFDKLKRDPAMKAPQAKQLAKSFAGAAGNSKTGALDNIWARHESLIGAGARAKATGGRTAA
jgi:hypothetical protein